MKSNLLLTAKSFLALSQFCSINRLLFSLAYCTFALKVSMTACFENYIDEFIHFAMYKNDFKIYENVFDIKKKNNVTNI